MGTRADFYVLSGVVMSWKGSVQWDGYEDKIPTDITQAGDEVTFTDNVAKFVTEKPEAGWPWHWNNSKITDYSYIFDLTKNTVFISALGSKTYTIYQYREYQKREEKADEDNKTIENFKDYVEKVGHFRPKFPDMRRTR